MKVPNRFLYVTALTVSLACAFSSTKVQSQVPGALENGPPPNLKSGPFRSVVDSMLAYSAKFRQQCQRLALARELVVVLLVNTTDKRSTAHASTEMSRKNGVLTLARVIIRRPDESVELIAHEIEHVIEQLDGVALGDRADARSTHEAGPAYESGRAREAGRFVASEVREGRGRVVSTVPGHDPSTSAVDPAPANVSADGRFMVFTSLARLTPDDEDDASDLYVFDIYSGRTTLESPPAGWAQRYRPQLYPRVSGDGRFIVFQAVDEQGPAWWQTLVLDRRDGSVRVLSVSRTGDLANGHCTQAAISADGSTVVFESLATNLAGADANGQVADIYAVRLDDRDVTRVSVARDGSQPKDGHPLGGFGIRRSSCVTWTRASPRVSRCRPRARSRMARVRGRH